MECLSPLDTESSLETGHLVSTKSSHFSRATWAQSIRSKGRGITVPQAIAHRGYSAKFPENTMSAFMHAVEVGAHAIETDIHLSRDGVVVLSHDATLKRCFGVDKRVIDCDWKCLSALRTVKPPHRPMPRLIDLLEYIAAPERANVWIILDIKADNNAHNVITALSQAFDSVASPHRPWNERVVLGCWTAEYLSKVRHHFPSYPLAITTFSIQYARQFISLPGVNLSVNQKVLMGCGGRRFLADAKRAGKAVFVWTVNKEVLMRWSVRRRVDGVITDKLALFGEIVREWEDDGYGDGFASDEAEISLEQRLVALAAAVASWVLGMLLMLIYPVRIARLDSTVEDSLGYA
ncbi:hypothetical protein DIZ76_012299 [Coccidioides immitis]|nr:hypothetical protein DIZ76_012299 [Coccidioides immitis]